MLMTNAFLDSFPCNSHSFQESTWLFVVRATDGEEKTRMKNCYTWLSGSIYPSFFITVFHSLPALPPQPDFLWQTAHIQSIYDMKCLEEGSQGNVTGLLWCSILLVGYKFGYTNLPLRQETQIYFWLSCLSVCLSLFVSLIYLSTYPSMHLFHLNF